MWSSVFFCFSSRRRHTRSLRDWSSDVCSSDLDLPVRDSEREDYRSGVDDWHDAVAAAWAREIATHLGGTGRVAFLIWGDPSLYDSSLRVARRFEPIPTIEVIPGVT